MPHGPRIPNIAPTVLWMGLLWIGVTAEGQADVSITLRNKGKDAYKPDVYGTAITIDLRITREGLRTYKLKAKSGQIVSTKKEELQFILDNYNIQVNNPVTILTQEMSKHFLHSKGEGDKYKFFMKATQLEQMKEDFVYIKIAKQGINDKLEQHGECLKELKVKKEEKEDRYRSLASLDDMQTKLEELQKQMAWVLVAEMEKDLLPLREKLQSDQQATKKFDEKVEEWKNKVADAELKFKQIHNQLENITARVQELQPQCAQLKAEASQRNNLLKSAEVTVHRCKTNLRDLETDKVQLSSRIDELKLSISQIKGAESQAREDRIQQLQNEMENLAHQDSTLAQQIGQYQQASQHAKDKLSTLKREHDTLQRSISGNSRNLQTMEASRSNRMRRFGEHMPDLLNSIQEAHRRGQFKERPRGPLGYCISLRDPELALPIEICLKGLLQAFTCDNHEDERVLQGLMANLFRVGQRPSIITSSFLQRIHDTSRRGVNHPDYPSVLQALDIEDPVVANCLIDQKTIESILLIKNRTDARRVMQGGNPPRNCIQAFSADGDQIFTNRSYTAEQTRANYLSGDIEEEIRHMQEELDSQRAQASHSQQQIRRVEEDMKQNDSLLRRTLTEQKNTKERVRKLQMDLTELQNVEEPQSEDLKPLEEELQDIIGKIASKQAECVEARTQAAGLKASYDEAEQAYRKHKEQISAVAEEADVIKEDMSKTDQEVVKCKHHKKHYEEKLKTHLSNIQTLKANLDGREQELRTSVEKAMEISPERLEVGRTAKSTAKSLDSEISRLKFKITTQQDQQGDREEIIRQYQEAVQNYKKMAQQMKGLTNFIRTLNHILNERLKVYNDLKRFLSARCKYYFDTLLAQRGYTGSMTFNHEREALAISVQPGKGDKADLSDMRSLSGGERSFSTVCFVLSLWAITEAPFRCLDEFDVYMDMVNRRISMDMMLKIAASQRYKQFIFLTPQSMSSLPESNLIQILRMKDPDRSSNFSPLGQEEAEQH